MGQKSGEEGRKAGQGNGEEIKNGVLIMIGFRYQDGELWCDGLKIRGVTQEVGTPFYLYSHNLIKNNYEAYREGFKEFDPLICYACKANSNLAILKALTKLGAGADVLSKGELFKALKAGASPSKIVFNGNGKREDEIVYGLENDILMFNVDSKQELVLLNRLAGKMGIKARVALRINPDIDPETHPYIATALSKSKFGIGLSLAEDGYEFAATLSNIEVIGAHVHLGSQITKTSPYAECLEKLLDLLKKLKEKGIKLEYVNLGGGLGIIYLDETPPMPRNLAEALSPLFSKIGARLILEPGRSIVGKAGILVTKVLYVKEGEKKNFIVVDAGMNDFVRPTLYGGYHKIVPLAENKGEEILADVVGPICEEGDFLGRDRTLKRPQPGDYLAVLDTGAYGAVMRSNYNSRPILAEAMVISNECYVTRRAQSLEEMIDHEVIPETLK